MPAAPPPTHWGTIVREHITLATFLAVELIVAGLPPGKVILFVGLEILRLVLRTGPRGVEPGSRL